MTKVKLTRKEREYMEREQLILDTAREILATVGYQMFSMERIASEIEYSKGTIYNHFRSKEDIVSTLCCNSLSSLSDFFNRARTFDACSRDKISALILGYALHAQLNPIDMQNMQSIKTMVMREKVSDELRQRMELIEMKVFEAAHEIIAEAIKNGDLQFETPEAAGDMITGMWAMGYGSFLLNVIQLDFKSHKLALPEQQYLFNAQKLLDGYQWQPINSHSDIKAYYLSIGSKVFPDELKQLGLI